MNPTAVASEHKAKYYKLIDSMGQTVSVRPPAARASATNAVEKIFGVSGSQETDYGTPVSVKAWVHQGKVPGNVKFGRMDPGAEIIGLVAQSDIVLSVKLEDVLVDEDKPYGRTILDKAKDVQVAGSTFKVVGTYRSGLAPLGPYILWVGLENVGE